MDLMLFLIGFVGFTVFLVMLIVNVIKKKEKRNALIGLAVCFVMMIVGLAMPTSGDSTDVAEEPTEQSDVIAEGEIEEAEEPEDSVTQKEEPVVQEETTETLSQQNAVKKAEQYLTTMAFSKSGLVEQLEFEGFSNEDATYAVNKLNIDWKEQAVQKGKQYLDTMAFSRSGLIEQLEFEGFTTEEATYAVDQLGL